MGIWKYSDDYKEYRRNSDGNGDVFRAMLRSVEHVAISIVEWPGLPDRDMAREIEYLAYTERMCGIDEFEKVPTVVKCSITKTNMYGEPVEVLVKYPDGSTRNRPVYPADPEGVVMIYDTQVPGFGRADLVALWADRYTDVQTTIDTQIVNQRTPLIVTGADKNQLQKSSRVVVDLVNGVKCLAVEDGVVNAIKALDLNSPWQVPDMVQLQHEYVKRMYSATGCDSQAWGKRERMIVDEQESDDESLAAIIQDMLNPRLIAADCMKEKYGWNVTAQIITPVRIKSETDTDDGTQTQEGVDNAA